ncbi:MAG: type III pantothenate kinase [Chloroflexi bacterium]|nr:type III pantothenate kinase [Chloroflexota bacterium]
MFLAIDIGNTSINIGLFDGSKLRNSWRIATNRHKMADEYAVLLLSLLVSEEIDIKDIKASALCAGVPKVRAAFVQMLQRYFKIEPLVVGAGIKTGVKILMDNPKEVGADRIVNSAAVRIKYNQAAIVVDLGTATTFDIINAAGEYIGGVISPGIELAAEGLSERAAALPSVELAAPAKVIGKNTVDAMKSGIVYGYAELVEGMIKRIKQESGEGKTVVVATGGYAELVAPFVDSIDFVEPSLTLEGLRAIYFMNRA